MGNRTTVVEFLLHIEDALKRARCLNYGRRLSGKNRFVVTDGPDDDFAVMTKAEALEGGFPYTADGKEWRYAD